jgi:hypothetical protein
MGAAMLAVGWQRGAKRHDHLGARHAWLLLSRWRRASGLINSLVGCTAPGGMARLNHFDYLKDFQISNQFKIAKYENEPSLNPKFSKL